MEKTLTRIEGYITRLPALKEGLVRVEERVARIAEIKIAMERRQSILVHMPQRSQ